MAWLRTVRSPARRVFVKRQGLRGVARKFCHQAALVTALRHLMLTGPHVAPPTTASHARSAGAVETISAARPHRTRRRRTAPEGGR